VETDERVPPPVPSFPPIDELVRVANTHDLRPVGPPMTEDQARELIARVLDRQGVPALSRLRLNPFRIVSDETPSESSVTKLAGVRRVRH
jgi:hypothetical protein